ncbi:hypothetical protein Tco_1548615, partial [Tanacetum coccineum]
PMKSYGIAKVAMAPCEEWSLMRKTTFWGEELKENDRDDE